MNNKKLLIMAGGTGGHVIPALTIAKACQDRNIEIHWLGTKAGLENSLVPAQDIPLHHISITGLRGGRKLSLLLAPFKLFYALLQSLKLIYKIKPNCVLGMGGFASGPGGIAAKILGKPLIIHEQNAIAGMTNNYLAILADRVLCAFPNAFKKKPKNLFIIGNPIRNELCCLEEPASRIKQKQQKKPINILVMGGSLGADAINKSIAEAHSSLIAEYEIRIWHQTGRRLLKATQNYYQSSNGEAYKLEPFINDMDAAYQWAELVICRAGALTVSELAAVGVASILIPYPFAVDDHQTANASYLANHNAAILVQQKKLNNSYLTELIQDLISNRTKLIEMAINAKQQYITDSAEKAVKHCLEVMENA